MEMEVKQFKKQHFENYKNAIIENIKKNTNTLVDEDIMSLLKKPPLEAMDLIKSKFLDIAKKEKIVLNIEILDKMMEDYRNVVVKCLSEVKDNREKILIKKVEDFKYEKETNVFKLSKKDFNDVNKLNKTVIKNTVKKAINSEIVGKIDELFLDKEVNTQKIKEEITKYLSGSYQRQLIENIEFKIIVKDTTLINGIKEQANRYLFTLSNSRLLKEDLEN